MAPAGCYLGIFVDGLAALVIPLFHGPVESLDAAAALLALVLGSIAVDLCIHPLLVTRPAGKFHLVFECSILAGLRLDLADVGHVGAVLQEEESWECCIL